MRLPARRARPQAVFLEPVGRERVRQVLGGRARRGRRSHRAPRAVRARARAHELPGRGGGADEAPLGRQPTGPAPTSRRAGRARRARTPCATIAATPRAKTTGATTPTSESAVCWKPIAAPLRPAPDLGGDREREPVPAHRQPAADDERRHEDPAAPARRTATRPSAPRPRADAPQRADAGAEHVRPTPDADPEHRRQPLADREHRGRRAVGVAALVVEEEDEEAHHATWATSRARSPRRRARAAGRAPSTRCRPASSLALGPAQTSAPATAPSSTSRRGRESPRAARQARQDERRDQPPDRHRRLPDAEREPALGRVEPAHHRAAARRTARAPPMTPARPRRTSSARKSGAYPAAREAGGAGGEAGRERPPLAVAVDSEAPGDHRDVQPHPLRREQDADLRQRQAVLVPQRRREHREPELDRREARLRRVPAARTAQR